MRLFWNEKKPCQRNVDTAIAIKWLLLFVLLERIFGDHLIPFLEVFFAWGEDIWDVTEHIVIVEAIADDVFVDIHGEADDIDFDVDLSSRGLIDEDGDLDVFRMVLLI